MKKRLIISLLVVNAIVLAACGTGSETAAGPRQILLGNLAGAMKDATGVEGGASDMPAKYSSVNYVAADEVLDRFAGTDKEATHPSWEFVSPKNPEDELQLIVDALDLGPGVKVAKQPNTPGGYVTTIQDGPTFSSYGNETSRWWYYSVDRPGVKDIAVSPPCSPDAKDCSGSWTTVPPAKNLPGVGTATGRATAMLRKMGVDTKTISFSGGRDEWSTYVNATYMLDGVATPMAWNFTFGDNGELTNAGGPVFTVTRGDEYPVITVKEAVERLNSSNAFGLFSDSSSRLLSPQDPGGDGDDVTVRLTSVTLSITAYWSGSGAALMLPAYVFGTPVDGTVEVLAVPDRFIIVPDEFVTPLPGPPVGTAPGSSGGGSGSGSVEPTPVPDMPASTVTVESARTLLGLSEAEATKVAEAAGWTLRVARRDGADLMLTQEYNGSRVNVALEKKVVTEIISIG
jgi:hypothetical protein